MKAHDTFSARTILAALLAATCLISIAMAAYCPAGRFGQAAVYIILAVITGIAAVQVLPQDDGGETI